MTKEDIIIGKEYHCGSILLRVLAFDNAGDIVCISLSGESDYHYYTKREAIEYGFAEAWRPDCFCLSPEYFISFFKPTNK